MANKIFVSCGSLGSGGAERVISILSKPLADYYDDVRIVLWLDRPVFYSISPQVTIINIEKESGSKSIIGKMRWFRMYVINEKPDLILSFLYPWSMKLILALAFVKCRIVVAERQDPQVVRGGQVVKCIRNLLYHKSIGILVQTDENRKAFKRSLYKKTFRIYNPNSIPLNSVGKAINTKKQKVIVAVGRLSKEKNYPLLIISFNNLKEKYPDYKLQIYGEGSCRKELESLIHDLHLDDRVFLMGNVTDVPAKIASAKLFVLSSYYEGMPNALIEAMCIGLPCISTRVSGARELIKDKFNGLLIDVDNGQQMTNAMKDLIDNEFFADMLARNAVKVHQITDYDNICNQWINYINSKIVENKQ